MHGISMGRRMTWVEQTSPKLATMESLSLCAGIQILRKYRPFGSCLKTEDRKTETNIRFGCFLSSSLLSSCLLYSVFLNFRAALSEKI